MSNSLLGYTLAQQGLNLSSTSAPSQANPNTSNSNTTSSAILRYPIKNIGEQDDYFKIQIIKYEPPGLKLNGSSLALRTTEQALNESGEIQRPKATIILPMPQGIQDNNSADWVSGTMNPLTANLAAFGNQTILSGTALETAKNQASNILSNLNAIIRTGDGQGAIAAGAVSAAIQALVGQGDASQIISRATGQVFNQNVEMLFNGVQIRPAFTFTFDMVPRSKPESDKVKEIIRVFKKYMSPNRGPNSGGDTGNGLFIKAPEVFHLEYMSGGKSHPFLHRFKPCALTQMSVNYNASAQYATYPDATPIHMQMTLQFQELTPIYQGDYDTLSTQGDTSVGY